MVQLSSDRATRRRRPRCGRGRRRRGRWPGARWARRCGGRSASRAASTRGCSRRPRPRTARRWRGCSVSSTQWTSPSSVRTIATRRPSISARAAPTAGSSSRRQTRTVADSRCSVGCSLDAGAPRRARPRSPCHEAVLQLGHADLVDDAGEEAAHDEAAGLVLGDAAGHEVEQLLVVEPAGGRGVAGADDLAGLDLEVRHRVGAGAVGEDEVAVELVGVGALGRGADEDVADPDGMRGVALQRALVVDVARQCGASWSTKSGAPGAGRRRRSRRRGPRTSRPGPA